MLACRVSPKQKADVVRMIRTLKPDVTTLAIGDGANDVNMITAAHVGIGISGLEGQQAARASDYAIGQFRFLKPLLFVHGREAYRRNSYLIGYMFYKNVLFVVVPFWFGIVSMFSGQSVYEQWIYQLYNIVFTAIPIMWYALFDYEFTKEEFKSEPGHYYLGLSNASFNNKTFALWVFYGAWQSALIFVIAFYSLSLSQFDSLWMQGAFGYAAVVVVATCTVISATRSHTWVSVLLAVLSIASYFVVFYLESIIQYFDLFGTFQVLMMSTGIYSGLFFVVFAFVLADNALTFLIDEVLARVVDRTRQTFTQPRHKKRLDKQRSNNYRPTVRHTGYAFAQEAGHVPQLMDQIVRNSVAKSISKRLTGMKSMALNEEKQSLPEETKD